MLKQAKTFINIYFEHRNTSKKIAPIFSCA